MFFVNDTATTEIYTLSLHDALPISTSPMSGPGPLGSPVNAGRDLPGGCCSPVVRICHLRKEFPWSLVQDRKSTRLNSSHANISYAVFCLKKKILITAAIYFMSRS